MMCSSMKPTAWVVAAPLFPFLAAAWVGGAARRKGGSCWTPKMRGLQCRQPTAGNAAHHATHTDAANDIVDTAVAAGSFATLVQAVQAAGLVDTLKGDGPFTVFAPTDDAFAKLPEGALDELLADPAKLADVLTYHVATGRLEASTLTGVAALKTVQGQSLDVDASVGVKVGSAYVVQGDIETSNGIIHAIDSVLLPA